MRRRAHLPCRRAAGRGGWRRPGVMEAARKGGMRTPARQDLLEFSLHTIRLVRPLCEAIARKDRDLASQVRRAMSSVALNLAEGFGNARGNERLRLESARGSLYEAQAGVRVAVAWGILSEEQVAEALAAIDRLGGRVYGLVR